jgi:hypothetical protein
MKIITANIDIKTIAAMDALATEFVSRSELCRVAIREYLLRELQAIEPPLSPPVPPITTSDVIEVNMGPDGPHAGIKTFRLIKKNHEGS